MTKDKKMRRPGALGFIGGGLNSAVGQAHFAALSIDGLWNLQAGVFSRSPIVNSETGEAYGLDPERVYSNLDAFLAKEACRLDAVVILTPTGTHFEIVKKCLQVMMPVICEKSLACTFDECQILHELNQQQCGFLRVIYNYSGYPMIREARHLIRSGALGELLHFQIEMPQEGYVRETSDGQAIRPQDWRLRDGVLPTIYLDLAVHLHQLIFYLTGDSPIKVIADQASCGHFDVTDNVSCMSRYSGGAQGSFWFSKSALGQRNGLRIRIFCSIASLEWVQLNPEVLHVSYANGRKELFDRGSVVSICNADRYQRFKSGHPAGFIEALANLYVDIETDLNAYKNNFNTYSDELFGTELSMNGLLFFEAMIKSFNSERWEFVCRGG